MEPNSLKINLMIMSIGGSPEPLKKALPNINRSGSSFSPPMIPC